MFVNGLIVRRHRSAFQVVRTDTVIRGLILSTGAKRRCKQGFSTIVCGRPPHQACRPRELPAKTVPKFGQPDSRSTTEKNHCVTTSATYVSSRFGTTLAYSQHDCKYQKESTHDRRSQ